MIGRQTQRRFVNAFGFAVFALDMKNGAQIDPIRNILYFREINSKICIEKKKEKKEKNYVRCETDRPPEVEFRLGVPAGVV